MLRKSSAWKSGDVCVCVEQQLTGGPGSTDDREVLAL